jgi:hypothetical protein
MSKKNLFMGGAALLLITFLALIGCNGAGTPIPPKPSPLLMNVTLGSNALTVTFSDTLANIDKVLKSSGYTTIAANYTVTKGSGSAVTKVTATSVTKGADDKSVVLAVSDVHKDLKSGDTITVELKSAGSIIYTVKAPKAISAAAIEKTKIAITFSDGVIATDAMKDMFVVTGTGVSFTTTVVSVSVDNPAVVILEDSSAAGIINTVKDLTIAYTVSGTDTLTGINGIAVETFTVPATTDKILP